MCTTHCTASACKKRTLRWLRAFAWSLALGLGFYPCSSPAVPGWWVNVLKPNTPAVDYAAANQGQLKNFAHAARDEMLAQGIIEAGHPIDLMVNAWTENPSQAKDYAPVNLGQLKAVAAPFYDVLIELEMRPADSYPWSNSSRPANDYAIANIGQLKAVFDFDLSNPDRDGDGMNDVFEQQIIDANAADDITSLQDVKPMDDYDGDRVPNLWEDKRNTNPLDAASVPSFDATVTHGRGLRTAYLGLPGGDYCSVVRVERGIHPGGIPQTVWFEDKRYEKVGTRIVEVVDQETGVVLSTFEEDVYDLVDYSTLVPVEPKKVLWLGDLGASRAEGHEGAVIELVNEGIYVSGTAVFDGVIVDGHAGISSPAITNYGHLRLSNSIIRHCSPANATGALLNAGSAALVHVTVHASHGQVSSAGAPPAMREAIRNEGDLSLFNSVVWDARAGSGAAIAGNLGAVMIQASLIQGGLHGSLDSDPLLNAGGYLTAGSTVCFNAAAQLPAMLDIQNQPRPELAADLGACQWVNTDASASDHLPDWWEQWWFGSLSGTDTGDPDLDTVDNLSEFLAMTTPTDDQDADGLRDSWEIAYWGSIHTETGTGNPDEDERDNLAEQAAGTNPKEIDADSDADDDGLLDLWELRHWPVPSGMSVLTHLATILPGGNPDEDGRNNLAEQAAGTNPREIDADSDADDDGLLDLWELRHWPVSSGMSLLTHLATILPGGNPDEDGRNNLAEQAAGTNPKEIDADSDVDQDGLLDVWELFYWPIPAGMSLQLHLQTILPEGNPDADDRNNFDEQVAKTHPLVPDADRDVDRDGLLDAWEIQWWGNIDDQDAYGNPDGDFMTNILEQSASTNPTLPDSPTGDIDGDSWLDSWELATFGSITESPGSDYIGNGVTNRERLAQLQALAQLLGWNTHADLDDDGVTMEAEWVKGTNPFSADTDGDGVPDNLDPMPLDSLVSALPGDVPGPPVLTLSSPVGATLLP